MLTDDSFIFVLYLKRYMIMKKLQFSVFPAFVGGKLCCRPDDSVT